MATDIKKGKDLVLSLGSTIYGYAGDCDVEVDTSVTSITSTRYKHKVSGGKWTENETDENSWAMNSNYVCGAVADYKALVALQIAGKAIDVQFVEIQDSPESSDPGATGQLVAKENGLKMQGKGLITKISLNAPVDGEVSYSVSVTGTGPLDIAE